MKKIVIINGPNLNLLGKREPHIYGTISFQEYYKELRSRFPDISMEYFQSNHEGALIDKIQEHGFAADLGMLLNAGGYTHTSVALRDAVAAVSAPVAEVHISDIFSREPFRRISMLRDVCVFSINGKGLDGYRLAIERFLSNNLIPSI
ncbi:MAG: 3-dehydroquinate dehydratase [Saprospirales bacterium]|nr:MAG: 3-dehydroquinate dehydratase [Saprospirales bacterium]